MKNLRRILIRFAGVCLTLLVCTSVAQAQQSTDACETHTFKIQILQLDREHKEALLVQTLSQLKSLEARLKEVEADLAKRPSTPPPDPAATTPKAE